MSNPPTRSERSYTVTECPRRFKYSATQSPDGPEPTIATVFPVRTSGGSGLMRPLS